MFFLILRGSSSNQAHVFRSFCERLAELRSLALTATATAGTINVIIENLCMYDTKIFVATPERSNLRYSVNTIESREPLLFLASIIENLKEKFYDAKKVLIFCRVMSDVRRVYKCLDNIFGQKSNNYTNRPYGMFHAKIDDMVKNYIISQFSEETTKIRVLISTIAFGMGVNCKGLYTVIHFGRPAAVDDYFQEAGRAGRDGLQSEAHLIIYPRSLNSKHILKSVKEYAKNKVICRRRLLLSNFSAENIDMQPKHLCCDICQIKCACCGSSCDYESNFYVNTAADIINILPTNELTEIGKKEISKQLLEIREMFLSRGGHCGKGINCGFPIHVVK